MATGEPEPCSNKQKKKTTQKRRIQVWMFGLSHSGLGSVTHTHVCVCVFLRGGKMTTYQELGKNNNISLKVMEQQEKKKGDGWMRGVE